MRRTIAILGIFMLGAAGCKHTCGKCDCGPAAGEATLYAPMQGYPVTPSAPVVTSPSGSSPIEVIAPPKVNK